MVYVTFWAFVTNCENHKLIWIKLHEFPRFSNSKGNGIVDGKLTRPAIPCRVCFWPTTWETLPTPELSDTLSWEHVLPKLTGWVGFLARSGHIKELKGVVCSLASFIFNVNGWVQVKGLCMVLPLTHYQYSIHNKNSHVATGTWESGHGFHWPLLSMKVIILKLIYSSFHTWFYQPSATFVFMWDIHHFSQVKAWKSHCRLY